MYFDVNQLWAQVLASTGEALLVQQIVSFLKPFLERLLPIAHPNDPLHDRAIQAFNGLVNLLFVFGLAALTHHLRPDPVAILGLVVLALLQAKGADAAYQNSKSGFSVGLTLGAFSASASPSAPAYPNTGTAGTVGLTLDRVPLSDGLTLGAFSASASPSAPAYPNTGTAGTVGLTLDRVPLSDGAVPLASPAPAPAPFTPAPAPTGQADNSAAAANTTVEVDGPRHA